MMIRMRKSTISRFKCHNRCRIGILGLWQSHQLPSVDQRRRRLFGGLHEHGQHGRCKIWRSLLDDDQMDSPKGRSGGLELLEVMSQYLVFTL